MFSYFFVLDFNWLFSVSCSFYNFCRIHYYWIHYKNFFIKIPFPFSASLTLSSNTATNWNCILLLHYFLSWFISCRFCCVDAEMLILMLLSLLYYYCCSAALYFTFDFKDLLLLVFIILLLLFCLLFVLLLFLFVLLNNICIVKKETF